MSLRDCTARNDYQSELQVVRARSLHVAVVLLLFAVGSCRDKPTESARSSAMAALPSMESAAGNDQRIAAMLSVHAHARSSEPNSLRGVQVMPLIKAAQFLATDRSPFADSRRRRAIAKLGGYRFKADGLKPDSDVDKALRILAPPSLGESTTSYIRQKLTVYTTLQAGDNPPSAPELESYVYSLDPFDKLATEGCPIPKFKVTPSGGGLEAQAAVDLTVGKGVCAVAAGLDPQSWDVCSKFFKRPPERAYLAHLSSRTPMPDPTLPPGTAYGGSPARTVFEHYSCPKTDSNGDPTGCDATLENMLFITTSWKSVTPGSRRYIMTYSLAKPDGALKGSVMGEKPDLLVDGGGVDVNETSSTEVTVTGTKEVGFGNPVLNGYNQAVFAIMVDELAGEFAELACCADVAAYAGAPCNVTPTP